MPFADGKKCKLFYFREKSKRKKLRAYKNEEVFGIYPVAK